MTQRQATLVAGWMNVGFIHGVLNTDNVALSGETIDYGPCAFLEAYDPDTVFSSIDHAGRYAYRNQPPVTRWNLARLAETLLPLIAGEDSEAGAARAVEQATGVIDAFPAWFEAALLAGQRAKLGLQNEDPGDRALADDWLALLRAQRVDFTLGWRRLADAAEGNEGPLRALFTDPQAPGAWLERWRARAGREGRPAADWAAGLRRVNPAVIPRNHRVEEALAAASDHGDLGPFQQLLAAVRRPFEETPGQAAYLDPAPAAVTACYRTFCGT